MEGDKLNNLEQEIQALEKVLEEKKEALKSMPPEAKEELVRGYTKERIEVLAPEIKISPLPGPEKVQPSSITPPLSLPSYLITQDEKTKQLVNGLIELSEQKGLKAALNQLSQINQPFLIDAFHDALTFRILQELKKRNVI